MGEDKTPTIISGMSKQMGNTQDGCTVIAHEGAGARPSHHGSGYSEDGASFTLNAVEHHAIAYRKQGHQQNALEDLIARRLTHLECTRLQGFPDGWVDIGDWVDTKGKLHKDSDGPKYKALGNSIALPFWQWMAHRMVDALKNDGVSDPTMASLFSGIGGFELVFYKAGCEPVWASEIEEFPMAVTKLRFPEGE